MNKKKRKSQTKDPDGLSARIAAIKAEADANLASLQTSFATAEKSASKAIVAWAATIRESLEKKK